MKNKWSPGKIVGIVFGVTGAVFILILSLYASMRQMTRNIRFLDVALGGAEEKNRDEEPDECTDIFGDQEEPDWKEEWPEEDWPEEGWLKEQEPDEIEQWEDEPFLYDYPQEYDGEYYEFHDEIRNDLSYQVRKERFADFAPESVNVMAGGEYIKVICTDKEKEKRINNALFQEIDEVYDYIAQVDQEIDDELFLMYEVNCYVAYMDADVLSVAYVEYGYLDDERFDSCVISVNIDMESGFSMTNSQILQIDDEFAIDFRERTIRQNGENDNLDYYTDQEITELLNDEDSLIIFYTPLGMEVGFNYYFGWVTVTYTDYKRYVNPL